jgi:hypothetical protein
MKRIKHLPGAKIKDKNSYKKRGISIGLPSVGINIHIYIFFLGGVGDVIWLLD